jgi:hypothetical protein
MEIKAALLLTFLISAIGCSNFPKNSLEMEKRAGYGKDLIEKAKVERPARKKERVEEIYMGGRKLSSGDWFVGGRLMIVVSEPEWIFDDPKLKQTLKF